MNATETDTRAQPQAGDGPSPPARAFDRLLRNNETFREQLQLTVHRMGLTGTGKRLLIIGAGSGAAVQGVPEEAPGWRVVAVDESHELTRHAQSEDWPPDYWFVTATLYNLRDVLGRRNLPGPFDGVLVVYEMRHQRNLDDTLAFLREILVPGAPLAVHEYSVRGNGAARRTWASTCLAYLTRIRSHGRVPGMTEFLWRSVVRFDSVGEFRERLTRARFTDVRVQTFGGRMEHVLHTFLARAPVADDRGGPDDLGLPLTDAPDPRGTGLRGVRGRVQLPEPRATPDGADGELLTHGGTADPDAVTPPHGLRAVPPEPSAPRPAAEPREWEGARPDAPEGPSATEAQAAVSNAGPVTEGRAAADAGLGAEVRAGEVRAAGEDRAGEARAGEVQAAGEDRAVLDARPSPQVRSSVEALSEPGPAGQVHPAPELSGAPEPDPAAEERAPQARAVSDSRTSTEPPADPTPETRSRRSEVRAVQGADGEDPFDLDEDADLGGPDRGVAGTVRSERGDGRGDERGDGRGDAPARDDRPAAPAAKPSAVRPAEPAEDWAAAPSQERPVEPAEDRPTAPTQARPAEPADDWAATPSQERPAEPAQARPVEPADDPAVDPVDVVPPLTDAPERRPRLRDRFRRPGKAPRTAPDGSWLTRDQRGDHD